jgi:Raf kinase inhibitor-like YbhB/YbcL family protein
MNITSPAFRDGGDVPVKYTCDGDDVSPPLAWTDVPARAKALALVCDDPDAPKKDFVHWVLFNVPVTTSALAERVAPLEELPDGSRQGTNDFGKVGYGGPCPPSGTHRYHFTLYAVDTILDVPPASTRDALMTALKKHQLGTARLTGSYTRGRR